MMIPPTLFQTQLPPRMQRMAEDLAEALSVVQPAPPPGGMTSPAGGAVPQPGGAAPSMGGMAPPAGGKPPQAAPGLGPNQSPSPLQMTTSFKSPPVESFLQKTSGRAQMQANLGEGTLGG